MNKKLIQVFSSFLLLFHTFPSKHSCVGPTLAKWRWIHVILLIGPSLVQRWSLVGNVAVGFQEKTYEGPMLDISWQHCCRFSTLCRRQTAYSQHRVQWFNQELTQHLPDYSWCNLTGCWNFKWYYSSLKYKEIWIWRYLSLFRPPIIFSRNFGQ